MKSSNEQHCRWIVIHKIKYYDIHIGTLAMHWNGNVIIFCVNIGQSIVAYEVFLENNAIISKWSFM